MRMVAAHWMTDLGIVLLSVGDLCHQHSWRHTRSLKSKLAHISARNGAWVELINCSLQDSTLDEDQSLDEEMVVPKSIMRATQTVLIKENGELEQFEFIKVPYYIVSKRIDRRDIYRVTYGRICMHSSKPLCTKPLTVIRVIGRMNSSLSTSNDMPRPGKTLKPLSAPLSYQRASFSRWEVGSLATFEWWPKFCRTSSYDYNQRRHSRTRCWIGSYMHVLTHTCVYPVCSSRLNYTASQPLQFLRKSTTVECLNAARKTFTVSRRILQQASYK